MDINCCLILVLSITDLANIDPKIGYSEDMGDEQGKGYSVNVPFLDGLDDSTFIPVFMQFVNHAFAVYSPQVAKFPRKCVPTKVWLAANLYSLDFPFL